MKTLAQIAVSDASGVVEARLKTAGFARALGFDEEGVARVGKVAGELAAHLAGSGTRGMLDARFVQRMLRPGIEILAVATGPVVDTLPEPGIDLAEGELFEAVAAGSGGTVALARLWASVPDVELPPRSLEVGMIASARGGAGLPEDMWAVEQWNGSAALCVAGFKVPGPEASAARSEAIRSFRQDPSKPPAEAAARLLASAPASAGPGVAITLVDVRARTIRAAGTGEVGALLLRDERVVRPELLPRPNEYWKWESDFRKGDVLLMHVRAAPARWDPSIEPGLGSRHPAIAAALFHRETVDRRAPACVIAAREVQR